MSIKNFFLNFFSHSFVSHLKSDGSVKALEEYRNDLIVELEHRKIKHDSDVIYHTTNKGIYNLIQDQYGDFVENLAEDKFTDAFLNAGTALFYTFSIIPKIISFGFVNPTLFSKIISEKFQTPANLVLGVQGSKFDYTQLKHTQDYSDEIYDLAYNFYYLHQSMIDYEKSGYMKLATISFTDILEDMSYAISSLGMSLVHLETACPILFLEDLKKTIKHSGFILYDIGAGVTYTGLGIINSVNPSLSEDIDNSIYNMGDYVSNNIANENVDIIGDNIDYIS